jgi:hypothetical protein
MGAAWVRVVAAEQAPVHSMPADDGFLSSNRQAGAVRLIFYTYFSQSLLIQGATSAG